jgi:uncharacterized protein YoxC
MADIDDTLKKLGAELRQTRDELRVQMHLAKADARDEWERLEKKWDDFEEKWDKVEDVAEDAGKDVGQALSALGAEIKSGYQKIRDAM